MVFVIFEASDQYPFDDVNIDDANMVSIKLVIAFVFEIPMLICQAHVMRNIYNLVWSNLNWDMGLHLEFMINLVLFCFLSLSKLGRRKCILSIPYIIVVLSPYMLVYLALGGWSYMAYIPKGVSYFGGIIGNNDNGIAALLYISMIFGVVGLYLTVFFPSWYVILFLDAVFSRGKLLQKMCTRFF